MTTKKITVEFLQNLLYKIDPDVTVTSFKITAGSRRGDNYTSMLYRVLVLGYTNKNSTNEWHTTLIYKCLPDSHARRETYKSEVLFRNEVAFYNKVLPALMRFEAEQGVTKTFKAVPQCYLAKSDVIVLEDLKQRGFVMVDRKKDLDFNHSCATVRELAHFHALSLAMKCLEPETYHSLVDNVEETFFAPDNEEYYHAYYQTAIHNALEMVKAAFPEDENQVYIEKFKEFVNEQFFSRMVELVTPKEPLSVICHGDCWTNNILFRYTETGEIAEVCLVDFQLVRYGSIALDLVYLLYICTSHQMRTENMKYLLEEYYTSLSTALSKMGCSNGNMQYCQLSNLKQMLQHEINRHSPFGLGSAIDMIPICTCDSDQAPDLYVAETAGDLEQGRCPVSTTNSVCQHKMAELVKEFVDNKLL